jgi:DNA-binding winged helix-turn-helix (wHTH) protein/tetratricopeptide (TPR) repeat protein
MSYRFDDYALDPRTRRLTHRGREIAVEPRVFDLVVYLVGQRPRAVGRDELIAAVWGRVDGSDATLAQAVLKARRLFGDDGSAQRTIRTVARFGYQWVAATEEIAAGCDAADAAAHASTAPEPTRVAAHAESASPSSSALRGPRSRTIVFVIAAAFALVALASAWRWHVRARSDDASAGATAHVVPGLILVAPANVHSAIAEDGWMRLGLMAMSADALRALPGHAVVPNETALAATAQEPTPDIERLRAATGAATIVTIDARHDGERWELDATLNAADGSRQSLAAESGEAVAAGAALARQLRAALAPEERGESAATPDVLATAARMQSAILEGHAERALAIAAGADAAIASAPEIALLAARAMNRVGRAADAVAAMRVLIASAGDTSPWWLALAWSTEGYSELVLGAPEAADQDFRRAIAASGGDRTEIGRAWRGLGNAEAAQGALDDAEASYLRARLELEAGGDRLLLAHLYDDLGSVAGRRGRFDEAIARYREAAAAAAAIGATEIELGARMNMAIAQAEQLHHHDALDTWRTLLPRVGALDYPSMQRYATVHYADALAETGAIAEAKGEVDRLAASHALADVADALEDVRLDLARVRLAIGDTNEAARELARVPPSSATTSDALRLRAALGAGDADAAREAAAKLGNVAATAEAPAHAEVALALAEWRTSTHDPNADAAWRAALAAARAGGSPRELRDVAVAYATSALSRGDTDAARTLAALVEPYAADDFAITLLLARITAAAGENPQARALYERAHALAGERWNPTLAAEASGAAMRLGRLAIAPRTAIR